MLLRLVGVGTVTPDKLFQMLNVVDPAKQGDVTCNSVRNRCLACRAHHLGSLPRFDAQYRAGAIQGEHVGKPEYCEHVSSLYAR